MVVRCPQGQLHCIVSHPLVMLAPHHAALPGQARVERIF